MNILVAHHYGLCFGVRDALQATLHLASTQPVTLLGPLVHNPIVQHQLEAAGVRTHDPLEPPPSSTPLVITAHGTSDRHRDTLRRSGHPILDATCPLVRKAHDSLRLLVDSNLHPVVIGDAHHVEVRGLVGDFPHASIVASARDIPSLPPATPLGIVAQTTQPLEHVLQLVSQIKSAHPSRAVRFLDTVCRPTKDRQRALQDLCTHCDLIVVVGSAHSNNTRQLALTAERLGTPAVQVETADQLQPLWFTHVHRVGLTAGTSTLEETFQAVHRRLEEFARS